MSRARARGHCRASRLLDHHARSLGCRCERRQRGRPSLCARAGRDAARRARLFLNASSSTPAAQLADPSTNLYSALAADGFHVVALAVWSNMGLDAAHQHDDAQTCPGATAHTAPIQCTVNAPRWTPLFE